MSSDEASAPIEVKADERAEKASEIREFIRGLDDNATIALQRVKNARVRQALILRMMGGKTLAEACAALGIPHP